jgi:hypothetical protein
MNLKFSSPRPTTSLYDNSIELTVKVMTFGTEMSVLTEEQIVSIGVIGLDELLAFELMVSIQNLLLGQGFVEVYRVDLLDLLT